MRVLIGEAALSSDDPAALTSDCPDDGELACYLDRTLTAERRRALESHFDRCQVCRALAFMLAGLDPDKR